ncbi:MAG: plasmid mobilization relaxosome protein MobC [Actinophytocola sp.]|uniref:plasmid mobilization protein n=1 Tax=Actinophytocola sp. TaxID=1872138 RepID=UPI003C74B704
MTQRKTRRQRRVRGGSPVSIHVRTTETTYAALIVRAAAAGLSVPRYLVESGLRDTDTGWSLRQQRWWAERLDTAETRLIRIGTNLNQIATVANSTGHLPPGLPAALDYLAASLDRLRTVLEAVDPADSSQEESP